MSRHATEIEFPVLVEYDYHKGDPGRTSGPPEKCYPPEPAYVEITSVKVLGVEVTLPDSDMERIQEEIEAKIIEQEAAAEQDYWDAERDRRRDERYELTEVIQEDCE